MFLFLNTLKMKMKQVNKETHKQRDRGFSFSTDYNRDWRIQQDKVIHSHVFVIWLQFVCDHSHNLHAVTLHHVFVVGRERDQDRDG